MILILGGTCVTGFINSVLSRFINFQKDNVISSTVFFRELHIKNHQNFLVPVFSEKLYNVESSTSRPKRFTMSMDVCKENVFDKIWPTLIVHSFNRRYLRT